MSRPVALFVGDVTHDIALDVPAVPGPDAKVNATAMRSSPGGMALNAAIACRRGGVPARLLVRVGDDPAGAAALETAAASGVDVRGATVAGTTAHAVVLLEPDGEKRLVLHHGVSMYPGRAQVDAASLDDVGWVQHAVYDIEAAAALAERCRAADVPWSLDLEPSTFPDGIASLAPCLDGADVSFCNAASLASIGDEPVARLFDLGVGGVIETRGAAGAVLHRPDGPALTIRAPSVDVVDTTGAGDCLAGRHVAARLRGLDVAEALRDAVAAASSACARAGTWPSYPWRTPAVPEEVPTP